jgi:hypothetical protein
MSKHTKVVSANYRDRQSPLKWLSRGKDEDPEKAKAFRNVIATNVKFGSSGKYESGFGCQVVALCETAIGQKITKKTKKPEGREVTLVFNGRFFCAKELEIAIGECKMLILREDGSMTAII